MSFTCNTIWPLRLDLSPLECRQILREKELLCYSDVVSVLRAQGPLSEEKKTVLANLQKLFSISDERNKAEVRRAANNEKLATIADSVSGFDTYAEWAALGALKLPPSKRPIPRTIYSDEASQTTLMNLDEETKLPPPSSTNDVELADVLEEAIASNRILNKDRRPAKTERTVVPNCMTVSTNTDCVKKSKKCATSTDGVVSLEYNLHLLSEIAAGESETAPETSDSDIRPDTFSIQHQIEDIELSVVPSEPLATTQSRHQSMATKVLQTIAHESSGPNSVPIVSSGQRYVLPRNTMHQGAGILSQQRLQVPNHFMAQQQPQSGTYLTLGNSQMRSPPSQISNAWGTQPQTQQVYIQNVTSHHGMGIQQNVTHQTMENLTPFGYTLQQRAVRAEQHQSSNKQNFIVRNLGSQPSMDPERNKRFMVVKGGASLGPSSKKPKISNPSNRQPGRPPLMPAPSSAYTSRPYVANEIFHNNRTSINSTSSITDTSMADSNGLKISSISSTGNRPSPAYSSQVRQNSYLSMSRGNGVQRTSSGSSSGSVVQLGTGSNLRAVEAASVGTSNALRPKNIQPVISLVPLSPRVAAVSDISTSSNLLTMAAYVKEENIDHRVVEKDPILSVKIVSKDEVYANIMDRVNSPTLFSRSLTDNKTQ